jgi:hypothetical protein
MDKQMIKIVKKDSEELLIKSKDITDAQFKLVNVRMDLKDH